MSDFIVDNDLCDTPLKIADPILSTNLDMTSGFFQSCVPYESINGKELKSSKTISMRKITRVHPLSSVAFIDSEIEKADEVNLAGMRHLTVPSSDKSGTHKIE